jgi:hypothetical protein
LERENVCREVLAMREADYCSFRRELAEKEAEAKAKEDLEDRQRNAYGPHIDHDTWLESIMD